METLGELCMCGTAKLMIMPFLLQVSIGIWQRSVVLKVGIKNMNWNKKGELVRSFWRNKIIEGSSRSGQMLRAALLKK